MSGSRHPCQALLHPTSRKGALQRRNPILCQAPLTFILAAHPPGPELPISSHRTWAGMRLLRLNAISHGKPCAHFTLIILEGSPIGTARWVMKKRLN